MYQDVLTGITQEVNLRECVSAGVTPELNLRECISAGVTPEVNFRQCVSASFFFELITVFPKCKFETNSSKLLTQLELGK